MLDWVFEFLANITICIRFTSHVPLLHHVTVSKISNRVKKTLNTHFVTHDTLLVFRGSCIPFFEIALLTLSLPGLRKIKEYSCVAALACFLIFARNLSDKDELLGR